MKKLISLVLVITMMLMLVGCGIVSGDKTEITRGKIDGATYTNEFLGFTFTKPESWVYSTDEELAAAFNMGAEMILGDKFKETLANSATLYDMMVIDSLTGTNINVSYENLSKSFASNITVEQYIEAVKKQLAGVAGMTVTFPEKFDTVKLGETEFTRVICSTTMNGVSFSQVYYLNKVDGYMCNIIATITNGYSVADIENMFK